MNRKEIDVNIPGASQVQDIPGTDWEKQQDNRYQKVSCFSFEVEVVEWWDLELFGG